MKKLVFLVATLAMAMMANAQNLKLPVTDVVGEGKTDTVTTTNSTAIYLTPDTCAYSADASFQVRIDTVHQAAASSLAGYAVLQYSVYGSYWVSGKESSDTVALIRGTDTCVVINKKLTTGTRVRMKIACSGTHKSRFGLAWQYKLPLKSNYLRGINNMYTNGRPKWNSDLLYIKKNFIVDSFSLVNTASKLYKFNGPGIYDGKMTVYVLSDTTANETVAGYAYLQASNDNKSWKNIETITLVRQDGAIAFTPTQTYYKHYRVKASTTGTHNTHFGVAYTIKTY